MRILLTSHGYPPTISGVTLLVQRLAHELVDRGHTVTVLAASDRFEAYEVEDHGAQVVRLASHRNPYWPASPIPTISAEALQRLVGDARPDVIHPHDALPFCLQIVRERERLDVPIVATCHYVPSFVAAYLTRRELANHLVEDAAWRYSIALYNRVDEVVFPTFTHRDNFVREGLTSSTRVISNGVDLARYNPAVPPLDVGKRYRLPESPRVLAVGRIAKDKNLEVLVRSMAEIQSSPPARLLLAGEGPYRDTLAECAVEAGVADRVHFLGFVPERDLPGLYRACNAFAIASEYEVQSIPALQAAATGLPIVAIAKGSLPEICRDGENGILVRTDSPREFAAALAAALEHEVGGRMGQASLRLSRAHDEQRTFDQYEALYRQVTSGDALDLAGFTR